MQTLPKIFVRIRGGSLHCTHHGKYFRIFYALFHDIFLFLLMPFLATPPLGQACMASDLPLMQHPSSLPSLSLY